MAISMHSASVPVFVAHAGQRAAHGSTRPRRMPQAKKFDTDGAT